MWLFVCIWVVPHLPFWWSTFSSISKMVHGSLSASFDGLFGTVLNNVCVTSWIESFDVRGWRLLFKKYVFSCFVICPSICIKWISQFKIQGLTFNGVLCLVTQKKRVIEKRDCWSKKRNMTKERWRKLADERLCAFPCYSMIMYLELIEATVEASVSEEVVLGVWVCAVPSEATFSAWTGVDLCAISGTSVTSGSFPQYDLQSNLTKAAHTDSGRWRTVLSCLKHLVFGDFLKACRLCNWNASQNTLRSLTAFTPSRAKRHWLNS